MAVAHCLPTAPSTIVVCRPRFGGRNWSNAEDPSAEEEDRDSSIDGYGGMGGPSTVGAGILNPVADTSGASPPADPREEADGGL